MERLTDKQAQTLKFIREWIDRKGSAPTLREIAKASRVASTCTVRYHLAGLVAKGCIERTLHASRGIRLTPEFLEHTGLPVLGRVAAGAPILAEQNIERYVSPESLVRVRKGCFLLEVRGDSMKEAGILNGDYVVVRPRPDFEHNRIGVAVLDGEATVKRLRRRGRMIDLVPANDAYQTMSIDPSRTDFRYAGEVTGVHREVK